VSTSNQDKTEAEKWADDVCSSISTWRDTASQARSTLRHPADLTVRAFQDTVRGVVDATRTLVTEMGNLGPPDTTAGKQAADQLSTLSKELEQETAVVKKTIQSHAGSPSEMLANLSTITGALATMGTDISKTVDDLGSLDGAAELREAFDSSASCQKLTAGASPT
jgi:ABC-type transporter Mla subunit MlaD